MTIGEMSLGEIIVFSLKTNGQEGIKERRILCSRGDCGGRESEADAVNIGVESKSGALSQSLFTGPQVGEGQVIRGGKHFCLFLC